MEFLRTTLMASSSDSTCFSEGAGTGASAVVSATWVEASSSDILLLFSSSLVITSTLKLIDYLRVLWCFFWPSPAIYFLLKKNSKKKALKAVSWIGIFFLWGSDS